MVELKIPRKEIGYIPIKTKKLSVGLSVLPHLEVSTYRLLYTCGFDHDKILNGVHKSID